MTNPCPICDQPIPERPRGSRHGHPPKTCSEACRRERKRRIEAARYYEVKGTEQWQVVRREYIAKLRSRLAADPEFAAIFRAEAAARSRVSDARMKTESPQQYQHRLTAKRLERTAWRERLVNDPAAWEAHKAKCREWYHSLTETERARIYRKRAAES